jgi:hypothetical protein
VLAQLSQVADGFDRPDRRIIGRAGEEVYTRDSIDASDSPFQAVGIDDPFNWAFSEPGDYSVSLIGGAAAERTGHCRDACRPPNSASGGMRPALSCCRALSSSAHSRRSTVASLVSRTVEGLGSPGDRDGRGTWTLRQGGPQLLDEANGPLGGECRIPPPDFPDFSRCFPEALAGQGRRPPTEASGAEPGWKQLLVWGGDLNAGGSPANEVRFVHGTAAWAGPGTLGRTSFWG